jgi:hypothetical protein
MPLLTELGSFGFAGFYKDVSPDGLSGWKTIAV